MIILFYFGSLFYIGEDGFNRPPLFNWSTQLVSLSTVFGNTVFVFIYHHSIPGIISPVRPQKGINNMFIISNIIGTILLIIEGQLAVWAFGSLTNDCTTFPCRVQDLYNENFQSIPVVGQLLQFYPLLNFSAIPILVITLRNNVLEVVPIKRWLA